MWKILVGVLVWIEMALVGQGAFASTKTPPTLPPSLSVVDLQLKRAETDFYTAQKMFNPWYGGPLITPGAHNAAPGTLSLQPYLFINRVYGQFDQNRKRIRGEKSWTVNPLCFLQMGLLSWLDCAFKVQGIYRKQGNEAVFHLGDSAIYFGIQLMRETPYRPALRLSLSENLPTGKYQHLNPLKKGIDATGSGAYTTTLSLDTSKVIWWLLKHPFAWRFSFNYSFPGKTNVQGYHAYGGEAGAKGVMHLGDALAIDTSIEFSFTKKWVLALDLAYTYGGQSTFVAKTGRGGVGRPPRIKLPSNESLSLSPAIEYSLSDRFGCLAGVWFPVMGKNTSAFFSGVFTLYYSW